jgi:hypothetical protein
VSIDSRFQKMLDEWDGRENLDTTIASLRASIAEQGQQIQALRGDVNAVFDVFRALRDEIVAWRDQHR